VAAVPIASQTRIKKKKTRVEGKRNAYILVLKFERKRLLRLNWWLMLIWILIVSGYGLDPSCSRNVLPEVSSEHSKELSVIGWKILD
jgi:hypothetical protein